MDVNKSKKGAVIKTAPSFLFNKVLQVQANYNRRLYTSQKKREEKIFSLH